MEKMGGENLTSAQEYENMQKERSEAREKDKIARKAESERIDADVSLREELKEKGKQLGVALAMPNAQLSGSIDGESYALDVRGRFCQQRGFMIEPFDWGKHSNVDELKGKMRPFVSHESHGIKWHEDEEAVRAEMAEIFPDDPLYEKELEGEDYTLGREGFNRGRKRIVKIIQNWEKMKDEQEAQDIAA